MNTKQSAAHQRCRPTLLILPMSAGLLSSCSTAHIWKMRADIIGAWPEAMCSLTLLISLFFLLAQTHTRAVVVPCNPKMFVGLSKRTSSTFLFQLALSPHFWSFSHLKDY
uniref:Uncharacterized protein n=1 Tax=Amblyomma tuberculatum TaxID=48802 RepID=A0A6M2E1X3_9ACAR